MRYLGQLMCLSQSAFGEAKTTPEIQSYRGWQNNVDPARQAWLAAATPIHGYYMHLAEIYPSRKEQVLLSGTG